VVTSPFTVIHGPYSCISSTVSTSPFDSSARTPLIFDSYTYAISDYVFTVILLVFFDSLAGKFFLMRSIKLCLVDNQWSSGVAIAESNRA
jgi:ABC-type microcin C transport system permease subunit YejB